MSFLTATVLIMTTLTTPLTVFADSIPQAGTQTDSGSVEVCSEEDLLQRDLSKEDLSKEDLLNETLSQEECSNEEFSEEEPVKEEFPEEEPVKEESSAAKDPGEKIPDAVISGEEISDQETADRDVSDKVPSGNDTTDEIVLEPAKENELHTVVSEKSDSAELLIYSSSDDSTVEVLPSDAVSEEEGLDVLKAYEITGKDEEIPSKISGSGTKGQTSGSIHETENNTEKEHASDPDGTFAKDGNAESEDEAEETGSAGDTQTENGGEGEKETLYVQAEPSKDVSLSTDETLALYTVEDNKAKDVIIEDISLSSEPCEIAGDVTEIALVKDSGYRHLNLTVYPEEGLKDRSVTLDGMMPKGAVAVASLANSDEQNEDAVLIAYDISILKDGAEYQPGDDRPVRVRIEDPSLLGTQNLEVWHIRDDGTGERITDFLLENGRISFDATGFSLYEIVEIQGSDELKQVTTLDGLKGDNDGVGFFLFNSKSTGKAFYFSNTAANNLITKTSVNDVASAAAWHFESVNDSNTEYYLYTEVNGAKMYMYADSNRNMSISDTQKTLFKVQKFNSTSNTFYIYKDENGKWGLNQFGGENGKGYGLWNNTNDPGSSITVVNAIDNGRDTLGLDGKTYGLCVYQSGKTTGAGMQGKEKTVGTSKRLEAIEAGIKTNPLDSSKLIATDKDLTEWTFHFLSGGKYSVTTEVDGVVKYLCIDGSNVSLSEELTENCRLNVTAGSGDYEGKIRISNSSNYSPNLYSGSISNGFGGYNDSGANEWFYALTKSSISEDDYQAFSAYKVSVSDTVNVANGKQVVIYTRIWNDTDKKYEFYIVDSNGKLVEAYESGDTLNWYGLKINNLLWDFTEYYYEGTTTPNYYYELRNSYSGKYLAPQIENGQILSDSPIGINLNGRKEGDYSSTILAWDDDYYQYAGLKDDDSNKTIVSTAMSKADSFYFAVLEPEEDVLTTVETLDNNDYGITMKMIDYNDIRNYNGDRRDRAQTEVMGTDTVKSAKTASADLVTKWMENGYPTATHTDRSLSEIFPETGMETVNHLFLENTHRESGYFEYNCTQNFATLEDNGNFTVYDQVGTIESGNKSLDHGQFMPYNDIEAGKKSKLHHNTTDETDQILSRDDPRRDKALYRIDENDANFYFGMELEANFTQTINGEDAWGHDIIFEFTGDDDFWLYVDDVLVIDLGGIHGGLPGRVNFKTGEVNVNGSVTDLRTLFTESYVAKYKSENADAEPSQDLIDAYLANFFDGSETVFKDYSTHNMKVFYMERGAGASNLHLRFNLSAVKPGQVMLSKEVSGTDNVDFSLVEYPFQIYYKVDDGSGMFRLLTESTSNTPVTYTNPNKTVKYMSSYTPPGTNAQSYEHVFFLNADDTVYIDFPDDTIEYYIVECGLNSEVYDTVSCNDDVLSGTTPVEGVHRVDYGCSVSTVSDRPVVRYDNHVKEGALRTLSITKKLLNESGDELTIDEDATTFSFRLYLENENATGSLDYANMYPYCVKDPQGNYCKWDATTGGFVSVGKKVKSALTEEEKEAVTFYTSPNGSISKIPANYTVEVDGLFVGSKFKLEEKDSELPSGYTLKEYRREEGTYHTEDGEKNEGTVRANESPEMTVVNQRGWGLTGEKIWSDSAYVDSHDPIFLAVYLKDDQTETLLDGSIRRLVSPAKSCYWFFDHLESGYDFSRYVVREVELTNAVVDSEEKVTSYDSISLISNGASVDINATPAGASQSVSYGYTVEYEQGTATGTSDLKNARTDTVSNTRGGGIQLRLGEWNGTDATRTIQTPLSDGEFLLQLEKTTAGQTDTETIGSYTTDFNGMISILYEYEIGEDNVYVLKQNKAPEGYIGYAQEVRFWIEHTDGQRDTVHLLNAENDGWVNHIERDTAEKLIADINVYNRILDLAAIKYDGDVTPSVVLKDAEFALYRQVTKTSGEKARDYYPISGYTSLISGADGVIPKVTKDLPAGTYYLSEKNAPSGYALLTQDLVFTISDLGVVTLDSYPSGKAELEEVLSDSGKKCQYLIKITNVSEDSKVKLTLGKTVSGNMGSRIRVFSFTLKFEKSDGAGGYEPLSGTYKINDSEQTVTLDAQGQTIVELSHDETFVIEGLPKGCKATVTEADYSSDGYVLYGLSAVDDSKTTEYIKDGVTNLNVSGLSTGTDGTKSLEMVLNSDTTVDVINHRQGAIPTGVVLNTTMLLFVGAAAAAGILWTILRRRSLMREYARIGRKKEEE
ncbi:MAG: hypothetical protein K5879_06850 [Lachnospiraceae bacterium]|nr:hypothetical protein [Lachnospiraceae bacterium]